jgi:hypothetical protein
MASPRVQKRGRLRHHKAAFPKVFCPARHSGWCQVIFPTHTSADKRRRYSYPLDKGLEDLVDRLAPETLRRTESLAVTHSAPARLCVFTSR